MMHLLLFLTLLFLTNAEAFLARKQPIIDPFSCRSGSSQLSIGTGFSFDDGEQVLVSVQKPLGIILEQDDNDEGAPVVVAEVNANGSAAKAGVKVGDVLLAVQNASVESQSLEYVMEFLSRAPRVVNLRFIRPSL